MTPAQWERQHATVRRLQAAVAEQDERDRRRPFVDEWEEWNQPTWKGNKR